MCSCSCAQVVSACRPAQYGREFHGSLTREQTDRLLCACAGGCDGLCDGHYLVRASQQQPSALPTLALRYAFSLPSACDMYSYEYSRSMFLLLTVHSLSDR